MAGHSIEGFFTNHGAFRTYSADDPELVKVLRAKGIAITATAPPEGGTVWFSALVTLLPMVLLVGVALLFMRRMPGMGGRAMGIGKSKAKLLAQSPERVTFKDVAVSMRRWRACRRSWTSFVTRRSFRSSAAAFRGAC